MFDISAAKSICNDFNLTPAPKLYMAGVVLIPHRKQIFFTNQYSNPARRFALNSLSLQTSLLIISDLLKLYANPNVYFDDVLSCSVICGRRGFETCTPRANFSVTFVKSPISKVNTPFDPYSLPNDMF